MIYTKKWRDPEIDPTEIDFPCGMKVKEILGYPHAANDVFCCFVDYQGKSHKVILKVERHKEANLENEWEIISFLNGKGLKLPEILTHGRLGEKAYIASKYEEGQRLSQILSKYKKQEEIVKESLNYMSIFGENLGKIHALDVDWKQVDERRFHRPLCKERSVKMGQEHVSNWLEKNRPISVEKCFIHGDHHYANILWDKNKIPTTLDWELCGIGWKEFDIAWALISRPSQNFLKSQCERDAFLNGYNLHSSYDKFQSIYCMVMIYQYFYIIGKNTKDFKYLEYVSSELDLLTR